MKALESRVKRDFPRASVAYVAGDTNANVGEVAHGISRGALVFCVVDPYALANLDFSTIRALSPLHIDFLVLIPSHMDANRNQARLLDPDYPILDRFLGNRGWRTEWERIGTSTRPPSFGTFLVDQFGRSMQSLGFRSDGSQDPEPIRRGDGRVLYYLSLYSRHPLGQEFWRKATRSGNQIPLPLGNHEQ